jgi:mRNA interferase YafQ
MKQFYEIKTYKQYDRDVKLAVRRGLDIEKLCHISPDWLLLYEKDTEIRIISLYRTGTHADIFGKGKKR